MHTHATTVSMAWHRRLEHTAALLTNDEVLAVLKDRRADRLELGASAHPCEKEVRPPPAPSRASLALARCSRGLILLCRAVARLLTYAPCLAFAVACRAVCCAVLAVPWCAVLCCAVGKRTKP